MKAIVFSDFFCEKVKSPLYLFCRLTYTGGESEARFIVGNVVRSIGRASLSQGARNISRRAAFTALATSELEAMAAEAADEAVKARNVAIKIGYTEQETESVCAIWECGHEANILELFVENNNHNQKQIKTDFLFVMQDIKTGSFDLIQKMKLVISKDNKSIIKLSIKPPQGKTGVKKVFCVIDDKNIAISEPLLVVVETKYNINNYS